MQDPARVTDDVTLALRGERIPLRNAVSSVYNRSRQELLVATPAALYLYGKMMTAGGDLLATLAAEENVYFQFVVHLPWLDAYSVVVSHASGKIEHRIVRQDKTLTSLVSDLKTSLTSHTLLETEGQFYTALANPHRRELITADTDGGIKVWALRVISNAQNNGGFKGVLRVHTAANSTKKPYYRHLHMSFDGQKIFAATSTKVYVFDAASCSRLPCCLREERRTIFSMDCGNKDNSVFLVFRMNMRKICKYSFVVKKGTPQFRKVGEYEHDQELAAFIENDHGTGNGVVMVDTYARFTTTEIIDSIRSGSDTTPQVRRSLSAVTLPYNPPSERYNALHVDTFGGDRNFVFAVWSTGFCIVELFFSDAQGRLLCDAFNGEYLKRLDDVSGGGIISIYEPLPSAQVVMFEEGDANFRFAALPVVPDPNIAEGEAEKSLPIVDYVVAADAVIALWPHGLVEKHNLSDNRVFTIAQPFESVATTATTMISLSFNRVDCVAVGDSTGAIYVFPLFNSDGVCHGMITRKQAHANDGVSALLDLDNGKPTSIETGHSLLSVSRGGEVKRWLIRRATQSAVHDAGPDFEWELVVCFRTYSPDVSTATFEFPEFVFCGFDGGSVECWRLPSSSENSSSKGLRRQAQVAGRISVVKRALHTIDLHLAPVRCILCESGSGELVTASSQPVADHFSWVFSYDEDAIILVWCFSLDFFFPHRRIKVHECIKGIYISPANGSVSAMTLDFGLQEKVSVVSLVEDEDESILLLDYRPGSRRSRSRKSRQSIDEDKHEIPETSFEIPFLPWDRMSERDRRVELMAASKSKCIQEDAERDEVVVPPVDDFESVEISVQLGIRSFTRWFAATHRHRMRIRERFLAEELLFAAVDPIVHQKLADVGLSPPPTQQIGLATSTAWQEFVSWYCLGLTTRHQTIPPEVLQRERLKSRTEYLELRLRMVAQSELEVQEEEERAGPCEEESEPPQRVYIFEHFVKRSLSDKDNPTSWENTSPENRQKEITLALMDPAVQIAAMRNDIELPDVSGSCMEDFDMLQLAGKFIPWWRATRNVHRRDFLKREVHEASTSKAILELLSKEQHLDGETIDRNQVIKDFFESYFRSDKARHTFLKKKLFYLKRKSRIASVARYGKLPAPLVVETLPLPLVTSFEFIEREIVEEVETEEFIEPGEEEEEPVEPEHVAVVEQPKVASIDDQREQEEEELRRREGEKAKITLELIYMAREDALSREYNNSFVESDEEVEEPSLVMPKRTDFSRSYFFGNLPMHYRKVASSGWRAGSGVDNGDEEHEEEEQLERERERQRLLDEQEAERLLELERQAERARIEKEREEKAFQFRRVRQAELKKVLVHQAELEAQRKAELEVSREMMEQNFMQREDELSCWNRDQLLRDQIGMQLEDQLAFQVRKELREAAAARMRMLLHEQACTSAEDKRSSLVGKELKALEHQRAVRRAFLSEIYTPFHPFYNDSAEASESFLPRIQWRLEQEQQRRTPVKPAVGYTIPLQDALVLDELDQDPYLARDSRKFKLLMGLPLRTPSSQKRPRIPTADAIIAMQQQQRQLDIDEERHESPVGTGKCAPLPHKVRPHSRTKNTGERSRLPDIMPKTRSVSSLTDLKEVCRKQDPESPTKRKPTKSNQQQPQNQQNQSLPFFRGNMLVQGHGQPRSKDYAY
ncbi:hypothetical protein PR002_g6905 [Phytophthora rubi]|uniref:Uncharacterized protein n=3 Tax=Phytophthora rubi TaxID=129364 RepID=A0A6A3N576_9STRA|nr:hypothetical protein PR002_g6905 [Phytophthora rubi]